MLLGRPQDVDDQPIRLIAQRDSTGGVMVSERMPASSNRRWIESRRSGVRSLRVELGVRVMMIRAPATDTVRVVKRTFPWLFLRGKCILRKSSVLLSTLSMMKSQLAVHSSNHSRAAVNLALSSCA